MESMCQQKRLLFRGCKDGKRPATLPCKGLANTHIGMVHLREFFPVHLYGYEVFIEIRGHLFVFKTLPFHHVAPVTRGISYGDEKGSIQGMGSAKGLTAPRIPVNRVLGVLSKIRALLINESVGHGPFILPVFVLIKGSDLVGSQDTS